MKSLVDSLFSLFYLIIFIVILVSIGVGLGHYQSREPKVSKDSILELELVGPIFDVAPFLESLREYREQDHIKGVLVKLDSPGGAVGPSQELFSELSQVRSRFQKPVVVVSSSLLASGGYYAAVAADRIVVNPGTLVGSIGVIMEFANLEKLYSWAKVERYSLATGKFKDSGSTYRSMRDDERQLFTDLLSDVHRQFKLAVQNSRKLSVDIVDKYADGRILTGESAVSLGFADSVGGYSQAVEMIGELAGLGKEPEIFSPDNSEPPMLRLLLDGKSRNQYVKMMLGELGFKTSEPHYGVPLFMMPGTVY